MQKILFLALGLIISLNVFATTNAGSGQKWYGPFTIAKVARYWDGYHRMSVHVNETPNTTCSVTNEEKKATYFLGPNDYRYATYMFSAVATAQAQNKKVMLLLDSGCDPTYGLNLHGVEILSD